MESTWRVYGATIADFGGSIRGLNGVFDDVWEVMSSSFSVILESEDQIWTVKGRNRTSARDQATEGRSAVFSRFGRR